MERYTNVKPYLEDASRVRFYGESGFDAASGDETGVTRGFLCRCNEALISCEHMLPVYTALAVVPRFAHCIP
jgi:hypothetical protein